MQDNTPRDRRTPYTGRFADPTSGARKRGTEPARPRAASDAQPRRPSGFAAAEPAKPRAAVAPKADEGEKGEKEEKKLGLLERLRRNREDRPEKPEEIRNKRSQMPRLSGWEKLLIGVIALALVVIALVLIFGGDAKPRHQMPRIERGGDSAYAPEEGAPAESGTSIQVGESPEKPALAQDASGQEAQSGEIDYSQYLVTPEPGVSLSDAAAAAGAEFDAANGDAGAAGEEGE